MADTPKELAGSLDTSAEAAPGPFGRLFNPGRAVLGVCDHLACRLGAPVRLVRVGFIVLGLAAGWGFILYLIIAVLTFGRSVECRPIRMRHNFGVVALVAAQVTYIDGTVRTLQLGLIWPVLLIGSALSVAQPTQDESSSSSGTKTSGIGRIAAGVALMIAGLASAVAGTGDLATLWYAVVGLAVLAGGLGLVLAPWYRGIVQESDANRLDLVRAQERAAVAAHLHDSVLQTLTLIQNRAAEPDVAAALAHQQERELRRWLYQGGDTEDATTDSFRQALENEAARVEDQYLKIIECIVVGDRVIDIDSKAVVAAAGEAMVNAAKFAEIPMISVYAEVSEQSVLVFVRDRGIGFDLATVPADRHGLTDSIRARIERIGGSVGVKTAPGSGTEIRLEVRSQ